MLETAWRIRGYFSVSVIDLAVRWQRNERMIVFLYAVKMFLCRARAIGALWLLHALLAQNKELNLPWLQSEMVIKTKIDSSRIIMLM